LRRLGAEFVVVIWLLPGEETVPPCLRYGGGAIQRLVDCERDLIVLVAIPILYTYNYANVSDVPVALFMRTARRPGKQLGHEASQAYL
jgi:hypothetical protein